MESQIEEDIDSEDDCLQKPKRGQTLNDFFPYQLPQVAELEKFKQLGSEI